MASKITKVTASASSDTPAGKGAAEPPKVETAEEARRRRAGIACFL